MVREKKKFMEEKEIINKVANSDLVSIDIAQWYDSAECMVYDLAQNLFQGLILKEKDFRQFLKEHNWESYQGKNVAIGCSVDAIIPTWAYMLLAIHLEPYAKHVVFGDLETLRIDLFRKAFAQLPLSDFEGKKVGTEIMFK